VRPLLLLGVLSAAACTKSYVVRTTHLARAEEVRRRTGADMAIAAEQNGETTYVRVEAIDFASPADPASGMQWVEADDFHKPLRIVGWIVGGFGLAMVTIAEGGEGLPAGLILTGAGGMMVILGYTLLGIEAYAQSPGFPATIREP